MKPPRRRPPEVLHVDDDLLVINKPSGYLVGAGNQDYPGVPENVPSDPPLAEDEPFTPVQRIDPDASGAVLYTRNPEARRHCEEHPPRILYHVLVEGFLEDDTDIQLPVFFDKRHGRIECSTRRGNPACTRVRVLERVAGNTWCSCEVIEGRHEQIRPHLAAIAHPLTFDPQHGNVSPLLLSRFKSNYRPSRRHEERPLVARLTMHVASIEVVQPDGMQLRVEAPLAKDLRTTISQLGRLT